MRGAKGDQRAISNLLCSLQGPAPAASMKERGAGDWQLYQSPAAVLKEVAARNAQARLPGPPSAPQAWLLLLDRLLADRDLAPIEVLCQGELCSQVPCRVPMH